MLYKYTFCDILQCCYHSFPFYQNPMYSENKHHLLNGGAKKKNTANTKAWKKPGPFPILRKGNIFKCFVKIAF